MYRMGQLDRVIVSKSFFRAEECVFHWSPNGNTVLVETHSSVDATGQSYMGESNLFLLSDRPGNAWSMKVPRTKDGPLHAVKWNPSGKEFAVIAGSIPPNVTLYNPRTGDPVFELGAAPRAQRHPRDPARVALPHPTHGSSAPSSSAPGKRCARGRGGARQRADSAMQPCGCASTSSRTRSQPEARIDGASRWCDGSLVSRRNFDDSRISAGRRTPRARTGGAVRSLSLVEGWALSNA